MTNLHKTIGDFHYVRVSLVIWRINGPTRIKNVDDAAGQELADLLYKTKDDFKPWVFDFKGVVDDTDGSLAYMFVKMIELKKEIHFINCEAVRQKIRNLYDEYKIGEGSMLTEVDTNMFVIKHGNLRMERRRPQLIDEINSFIDKDISSMVEAAFVPNPHGEYRPLSSTPILATGQYDASKIISNPAHFPWVCLRLADLVEDAIVSNKLLNTCLLSVSLRSSPFANAISLLLDIGMKTIDHLGPFHKVWDFESFYQTGYPNTNYIFIGDFIVGGTELKLAHLFSKYCESDLYHAVVIGNVIDTSRYAQYKVKSLLSIRELHSACKYKLFE